MSAAIAGARVRGARLYKERAHGERGYAGRARTGTSASAVSYQRRNIRLANKMRERKSTTDEVTDTRGHVCLCLAATLCKPIYPNILSTSTSTGT